ncbi:MAG TPA: hypothetical protein VFV99_14030 [Kofleriaceae bacterium]|nr:hypothetical protein [Kofleriaceae bacterium]
MRALLIVALVGCASGPNVDAVIASHHHDRTIAAPAVRAPRPWEVGQWTLSKTSSQGHVGTIRRSIVAKDACGFWLEVVATSPRGRTITKTCYRSQLASSANPAAELDALQAIMIRQGGRTIVIDFRNGKNPAKKLQMQTQLQQRVSLAWQSPSSDELATIVVPAGRFEGAAHVVARLWVEQSMQTAQAWLHPAVPIDGVVKESATDGSELELLDYGLTGAKSELPSFDEQLSESGLAD